MRQSFEGRDVLPALAHAHRTRVVAAEPPLFPEALAEVTWASRASRCLRTTNRKEEEEEEEEEEDREHTGS